MAGFHHEQPRHIIAKLHQSHRSNPPTMLETSQSDPQRRRSHLSNLLAKCVNGTRRHLALVFRKELKNFPSLQNKLPAAECNEEAFATTKSTEDLFNNFLCLPWYLVHLLTYYTPCTYCTFPSARFGLHFANFGVWRVDLFHIVPFRALRSVRRRQEFFEEFISYAPTDLI